MNLDSPLPDLKICYNAIIQRYRLCIMCVKDTTGQALNRIQSEFWIKLENINLRFRLIMNLISVIKEEKMASGTLMSFAEDTMSLMQQFCQKCQKCIQLQRNNYRSELKNVMQNNQPCLSKKVIELKKINKVLISFPN